MTNKCTTILIGNGLGMSIDADYFRMDRGIEQAWSQLSVDQQNRIMHIVSDQSPIDDENQLDKHYAVVQACLMLSRLEKKSRLAWLIPEARSFPNDFREFIANTAWHFYKYPTDFTEQTILTRLNKFIERLINFITRQKTHIVTLNYDALIYHQIIKSNELKSKLTDGFNTKQTGFHSSILSSRPGYYLHLHGSPLFYTDLHSGEINKNREDNENHLREHLILCNTSLKRRLISSSLLLNCYWDFYKEALYQSDKIILFGYSGNDTHVNEEISNVYNSHREIIIVEYPDQQMEKSAREKDWSKKLKLPENYFNDTNLIWLDSILDFEFK